MILTLTLTPALDKTVVLPQFAVGRVNRIASLRVDPGGKGINVSKTLKALGAESVAGGILGGANGEYIKRCLDEMGIENDFVSVPENTRTNLKVVDPVNHTNTDINEPGAPVSAEVLDQVLDKALARLTRGDIAVLAGKAPQGAPDTLFAEWTLRLREKGVKVYLDADGELLIRGAEALPAMIKPNDEELSRLMGRSFSGAQEMAQAALALVRRGMETVVVSMGGDGALFARGNTVLRGYGLQVPVQSTVGAGDSMMAAMCYGEATGLCFEETCRLAMAVSAAAVMQSGTQSASMDDVRALLDQVRLEPVRGL